MQLARETLAALLDGETLPHVPSDDPRLLVPQGVFVTLRRRDGTLRGCLGRADAPAPLAEGVRGLTVASATRDPRFPPLHCDELPHIHIELSVLWPLEPLREPGDIRIGLDGLELRYGEHAGLLLPQVAPHQGWDTLQFLEGVCRKAGLPAGAWRWPGAELYRFRAQIFGENGDSPPC